MRSNLTLLGWRGASVTKLNWEDLQETTKQRYFSKIKVELFFGRVNPLINISKDITG
jgi:hypothetical protein